MFKVMMFVVLAFTAITTQAAETVIRQTRPDGTIDYGKPAWQVDKAGVVTQLRKNGTPDHSQPRYKIIGDKIYNLHKDGTVDRSKLVTLPKEK